MSNSEMLIPIKVLKSNESAFQIYQQFIESIDELSFSEIPTINKLKQTLQKGNFHISNEEIRTENELSNWSIEINMTNKRKFTIWANSLLDTKLECIFIGTENESIQNKVNFAKVISREFGHFLFYSMTGEGFVIESNETAESIEQKYIREFKGSSEWKKRIINQRK